MYKITSYVFGELKIGNRVLSYNESMAVSDLDDKITVMRENKLIKVVQVVEKPKNKIQTSDLFSNKDDKPKKKKNT
jgi:hypothetical protein